MIKKYTNHKLPSFFQYAKDKDKSQVELPNDSFVNKIYNKIPDKPINTRGIEFGRLEYKKMMSMPNMICSKEVITLYNELNKKYHYMINMKDEYLNNLRYISCSVRKQFNDLGYSDSIISDMLVQYLYSNNKRNKHLLWFCYGQNIYNNIKKNLEDKSNKVKLIRCKECGEWFETSWYSNSSRCKCCQTEHRKLCESSRKYKNTQTLAL